MEVLFDIDGVLLDRFLFRDHLRTEYGIDPETTWPFFQTRFSLCTRGEADLLEELPPFLDSWGWAGSPEDFIGLWFSVENVRKEDTLNFVADLRSRGTACHIASNQEQHRARYLAEVMGFQRLFDRLFFSCHLGVQKPDSAYFAGIEEALGRDGRDLLFIDDLVANVEAAKSCGWNAVHFVDVHSLDDVTRMLRGSAS